MSVIKIILVISGCLLTLVGFAGIALYTTYVILPGPIYLRNNFIGLWLSILLTFFSLEFIYCVTKAESRVKSFASIITNVIYYILVALGAAFVAFCYGLVWRVDSLAFAITIFLLAFSSIAVLLLRRANIGNRLKPAKSKGYKATTEMEKSISSGVNISGE